MRRYVFGFLFLLAVGFHLQARALYEIDVAVPMPGAERIALADAILVGRVMAIEPQDVEVMINKDAKAKYRIAVVTVNDMILGKKETKTIRVGFVPIDDKQPPMRRRYPVFNFKLDAGQHGLMYLRKHPTENFYVGTMHYDFVPYQEAKEPAGAPQVYWGLLPYPQDLKKTKHIVEMLNDPIKSLKATDATDRATAATHLVARYRAPKGPGSKTEPITLEESKLILSVLLEQDWANPKMPPNPWQTFSLLGLTEKDGWKSPTQINNLNDLRAAARAWHEKHGDYRIQRYVAGAAGAK